MVLNTVWIFPAVRHVSKLKTPSFSYSVPPFVRFEGLNWDVDLNPEIPLTLDVETGASEARLDLFKFKGF